MINQYVLLYPITEDEFHFSLDELKEAITEAGANSFVAGDALFVISHDEAIVQNIRTEHNIPGAILKVTEIIL